MTNEEANKVLEELHEEWKNISNYDGRYKVSSYGKVKNKKKVMSLYESHGYLGVFLSNGNGKTWHSVHRLVAEAFLDKKYFKCLPSEDRKQINLDYLEVNHKDENKQNNKVENLEWCSRAYNINYGTKNKRVAEKLSEAVIQFDLNGSIIGFYKSIKEAGEENKVNYSSIVRCCRKQISNAGGFIWRYAKEFGGICNER